MSRWFDRSALTGMSLLLLVYDCVRAARLSFTYDEVVSVGMLGDLDMAHITSTANVHLLNSALMAMISWFGGSSEFAMRSPNILALIVYLWAAIDLGRHGKKEIGIIQFILLAFNPFVFDFFGLARGYGLGLAAMLASIAFIFLYLSSHRMVFFAMAIFCGMISVLGNFTFLNFFVPEILLLSVVVIIEKELKHRYAMIGILVLFTGLILICILPLLVGLREAHQLYFGGRIGFFEDTIISIARCTAYFAEYAAIVKVASCAFFLVALLWAVFRTFSGSRRRITDPRTFLAALFLLTVLSPLVQKWLLGTYLPVERTALFYYPLTALCSVSAIGSTCGRWIKWYAPVIGVVCIAHFCAVVDPSRCYSWRYDCGSRDVVKWLKERGREHVQLGVDFFNGVSIRFYRDRYDVHDLQVVELTSGWDRPTCLEELDPAYFGEVYPHGAFDPASMRSFLQRGAELYYLDRFYLDEMDRLGVRYEVLKAFPSARTSLVGNVTY